MGTIAIYRGNMTLGRIRTDKAGGVIEKLPPKWEDHLAGACVALVPVNPETMEQEGAAEIFGDYDAAHYLARILELIHPNRQINIPNLKEIIRAAAIDGADLCDYCRDPCSCRDCIVKEWKEEAEE